jgi:nitrogen fixation-related uncharacterized protein
MTAAYIILGFSLVAFGAMAVTALVWAARAGQFENFKAGSESIFDSGEPIGEPTDVFPDIDRSTLARRATKGAARP